MLDAGGRKIKYHAFVLIMGHSRTEINKKFQEDGVGMRDNKPFQEYEIPEMGVVQIMKNYAVVGKSYNTRNV
ncbi:hypothetical protein ACIZ62_05910 [Acetobacterium carbinolicum]|uniref:hypothetical protein n=1 Tax=Acetobacterium carbinolicum TaxID=52690 RepID=UPI0039BEF346